MQLNIITSIILIFTIGKILKKNETCKIKEAEYKEKILTENISLIDVKISFEFNLVNYFKCDDKFNYND